MSIQLKQSLKLGQNLVMTPQLQQAIKLLQLNHMELADLITQELTENPVLEELSPDGESDSSSSDSEVETLAQQESENSETPATADLDAEKTLTGKDDVNWDAYLEDYNNNIGSAPSMKETPDELPTYENVLTKKHSLEEHLQWQLSMLNLRDDESKLGMLIIMNLNDEGYLEKDLAVLAQECEMELEDAEEILKMIQNFDPVGVAARNLQECLSIQAKMLSPRQPLVEAILEHHMAELEKHNLPAIAKALQEPLEKVVIAQKIIHEFEPKPGSLYTEPDAQYISPDIYINKISDEFVIHMNDDGIPRLRVSNYYKSIIQGKSEGEKEKQTRDYVQDKLKAAMWLIRSIQNRQKTIYKVTEAILARQKDFFEKGTQYLKPMVLKDIASDVGMHESTISRVTTNKYVHTPVGTFELKYFFNSSIASSDGADALASSAVKEKIKLMIAKEDPKKPLSDQQIVELLKRDNVDIARRTVAKYREMLNILPSSKRKRLF